MNVPRGTNSPETRGSKDQNRPIESEPEQTPPPNAARPNSNRRELLLFPNPQLGNIIPKRVSTFDERYVLHCLELLHNCALRAAASKVPTNRMSNKLDILSSSPLLQKFDPDFGLQNFLKPETEVCESPPRHKHKPMVSLSSTTTALSEESSSAGPATSFQGLLTCTWKDGLPNHVFSVDDKSDEVYVASLSRTGPSEFVYTFRSRKKEFESGSVGTMRVSTSNESSVVRETRFVLSLEDHSVEEVCVDRKRSKRLKSKVSRVFRRVPGPSSFSGSEKDSVFFEDSLWDPSDAEDRPKVKKVGNYNHGPNLEVGAVVVREKEEKEEDRGGWGLKFLKKSKKPETSLDVLIPNGVHGGPRPSGLVERWVSGGRCDCGGWDVGCQLAVFTSVDDFGVECNSVDLVAKGSKEDFPTFKMANIHDGLYYVRFGQSLSALQSFAIAAAIVHSRSQALRSEVYRK